MEDAFRFAVLALFEANQSLCAEDPHRGRFAQHTVLDVPAVLERHGFRRQVLKRTRDPVIRHWFEGYFEALDPKLRMEVINPVQTKVHKYLGSQVARQIVGQSRSTVDFRQLIAEHKVVIVNLNAFDVGEDVAALVGGTLLNLAARAISAQAVLPAQARKAVTLVVDEFHTLPGADYEQILGELAKYGANVLLASQTLSRLDRLTDSQRTRDLRAAVFSNLDGLFAFHCSAEDAAYLAEELGGTLDAQDLLELGHYQCYARVSDARTGERLPASSWTRRLRATPNSPRRSLDCRQSAMVATRWMWSSIFRARSSASAVRDVLPMRRRQTLRPARPSRRRPTSGRRLRQPSSPAVRSPREGRSAEGHPRATRPLRSRRTPVARMLSAYTDRRRWCPAWHASRELGSAAPGEAPERRPGPRRNREARAAAWHPVGPALVSQRGWADDRSGARHRADGERAGSTSIRWTTRIARSAPPA